MNITAWVYYPNSDRRVKVSGWVTKTSNDMVFVLFDDPELGSAWLYKRDTRITQESYAKGTDQDLEAYDFWLETTYDPDNY